MKEKKLGRYVAMGFVQLREMFQTLAATQIDND